MHLERQAAESAQVLYLAITNRKKVLADLMVRSCPDEPAASQCLADALEDTCGNEKRKTCLHLAFELDLKPATLMRMLKNARSKALASVDITGKRPMHYAVHYSRCDVGIVSAFIEKDNEALRLQRDEAPNRPPNTFLDVAGEVERSVYQEHVATAPADDENIAKKDTSEDNKKKRQEQPQSAQGKSEPKAASRQEQPGSTASRDSGDPNAPERGSGSRDRDREKKKGEDNLANSPPRRAPTMPIDVSENKTEKKANKPLTSTEKPRRSTKPDTEDSAATSKIVLRLLKLHYMRTRSIQNATAWLYGTNPQGT